MRTNIESIRYFDYVFFVAIGLVFFQNGISKIYNINGVMSWMESYNIPGFLIYPSIGLELIAPMMILFGIKRSLAAIALMFFCLITAIIFHSPLSDPAQLTAFLKNIALCAGFYFIIRIDNEQHKINDSEEERENT